MEAIENSDRLFSIFIQGRKTVSGTFNIFLEGSVLFSKREHLRLPTEADILMIVAAIREALA